MSYLNNLVRLNIDRKVSFVVAVICMMTIGIILPTLINTGKADPAISQVYGCTKVGLSVRCDPMTNKFSSFAISGHAQRLSTINATKFNTVEGVYGNALPIYGYRQQFLSLPNQPAINPSAFSVALWLKQDPVYLVNASVISHVNSEKSAGWYMESVLINSQSRVQFSVTNSDGKIFSASSPIDPGIFQNIVGVFDGKSVKLYLNGFLADNIAFVGNYDPDPNLPLNIGVNSYDYGHPWNGVIDEVWFYENVISYNVIQKLSDYSNYIQLSRSSSKDDGIIGYWSFDDRVEEQSANSIDAKMILPAVNMVFSPDGRLFYSIMDAGEIRIVNKDFIPFEEPFVMLQDASTNVSQEIHGITLDPNFLTNHYLYAYVTATDNNTGNNFHRIMRFKEFENKVIDQRILIDNIPATGKGRVFAGALAFGTDDKLYVGTGYTSQIEHGQNANLTGKVLRINRDGSIPRDNPFPNSAIYTLGHRNVFGIASDKTTEMVNVAENGANHYDEINVLKSGGNYGYPFKPQQSSLGIKSIHTDNSSAVQPARTYYNTITPGQMIFYDDNRFRDLKGMFLFASYKEGSIYGLSFNETGSLVEEVAIRLPEVRGRLISIAAAPNGEIYIAGENMYRLVSVDNNRATSMYFVDTVINNNDIQINGMSLNLTTKVLSIDISNSNANTNITDDNGNTSAASPPSLRLTVPKTLLGIISEVTSEDYNMTSKPEDKTVENFKTKETRRVTNVGDTVIDIQLNGNFATDKILIKGQTSTLVQPPSRNIQIQR